MLISPIPIGVKSIMEKRHSRTEQLRHIEAWQRSGLSKPQYCRQHHIAIKSLYNWLRKHPLNDEATTVPAVSAFMPVRRMPAGDSRETVTLNLPNGCSVNCLPAQLLSIMQALSLC
jgi:hypothetical protein